MPDVPTRGDAGTRVPTTRTRGDAILEQLVAANALNGEEALRLLVVAAHPDDEAIGAGALLGRYPHATIAHLTDGGGIGEATAKLHDFACRGDYAAARRAEVIAALSLVGIPDSRVRSLGIPDGDAGCRLVECCRVVMELLDDVQPDVVLTHPYEGGHTDHDAAAFAVHLAAGVLRREGGHVPVILELTSYHRSHGRRVRGRFIPRDGVGVRAIVLDSDARRLKTQMLEAFSSQWEVVRKFPVEVERFRVAPRYLFTEAPHEGVLDYERYCVGVTGEEWRAMAASALEILRARKRPGRRRED